MMGCVIFGVETLTSAGAAEGITLIVAGLAAGALLVRREWGDRAPLFPVDLLRIRIFSMSIATSTVSFAAQTLAFVGCRSCSSTRSAEARSKRGC